jgi:hypothetical protein
MRLPLTVVAVSLAVTACGGGGDSALAPDATHLAFQSQPSATTAGQPMAPPVQVSILDASGNPVAAASDPVTLAIGSGPAGVTLGGTVTVSATGGLATFPDLRITRPGTGYTLSATATGLAGATSAAFDVSPIPGLATAIAPLAGDGQTAIVNQAVAIDPAVKVTDGFGDPVAGVVVSFAVESGNATVTGAEQTTDPGGVATVGQWILSTGAGLNALSATSPDLQGSPVTFTATGVSGPAVAMVVNGGDDQSASLSSPVAEPPSVLVTDTYGNPVQGSGVTFAVISGRGNITGATPVSGPDGVAAVGTWTLGPAAGANTLKASSAGLTGSPITFHAMGTVFPSSVTVEVHNDFFLSLRNGSGANPGLFGSLAVDTIGAGGTVTWRWAGQGHNVTPYQNSAFTPSPTQSAPFTFGPITFASPGTYLYRCTVHSQVVQFFGLVGMRGEIVVR